MRKATALIAPILASAALLLAACESSPEGKIAFVSSRDGNSDIYVVNADGSGQTNLTNNPADDDRPVWLADGSRVAFVSNRDGNSEIYAMNADGSDQTNLTNNPAVDCCPN